VAKQRPSTDDLQHLIACVVAEGIVDSASSGSTSSTIGRGSALVTLDVGDSRD